MQKAIVIGVGPGRGPGAQICHRFASLDLRVVVAGRTQESPDAVVAKIQAAGGAAEAAHPWMFAMPDEISSVAGLSILPLICAASADAPPARHAAATATDRSVARKSSNRVFLWSSLVSEATNRPLEGRCATPMARNDATGRGVRNSKKQMKIGDLRPRAAPDGERPRPCDLSRPLGAANAGFLRQQPS